MLQCPALGRLERTATLAPPDDGLTERFMIKQSAYQLSLLIMVQTAKPLLMHYEGSVFVCQPHPIQFAHVHHHTKSTGLQL